MKRKFSMKYRIEKWFFEDSKDFAKKASNFFAGFIVVGLMFGMLFFIPALFH